MRRGCAARNGVWLVMAVFAVCAGPAVEAEVLNIVQTNITSAQSDLDVDHSYSWTFSVAGPQTFDAVVGKFTLKTGSQTSEPAVLELSQADGSFNPTTLVASYAYPAASASQSYTLLTFALSATSMTLNGSYILTLESNAVTTGSKQWFIKDPAKSVAFENDSGGAISGFSGGGAVPVPEPSWPVGLVLGGGVAWVVLTQWRVRRRMERVAPAM